MSTSSRERARRQRQRTTSARRGEFAAERARRARSRGPALPSDPVGEPPVAPPEAVTPPPPSAPGSPATPTAHDDSPNASSADPQAVGSTRRRARAAALRRSAATTVNGADQRDDRVDTSTKVSRPNDDAALDEVDTSTDERSHEGIVDEEPPVAAADEVRAVDAEAAADVTPAEVDTADAAPSGPASSGPASSEPASSKPAVTGSHDAEPNAVAAVAEEPTSARPATTDRSNDEPATAQPVTAGPATTQLESAERPAATPPALITPTSTPTSTVTMRPRRRDLDRPLGGRIRTGTPTGVGRETRAPRNGFPADPTRRTTGASAPPATPSAPASRPAGHSARRRTVIAAVLAACLLVAGIAALATRLTSSADTTRANGSPSPRPTASAAPLQTVKARMWFSANVPTTAVVVASPAFAAALRTAGFTHAVGADRAGTLDRRNVDYVVRQPGQTADDTSTAVRALQAAGVAVARFGVGPSATTVMQVTLTGHDAVVTRRTADVDTRRSAGAEVLTNPTVRPDDLARRQLQAGQLDLRAVTAIAVVAGSSQVIVRGVAADPAEAVVGTPVRRVVLATTSAADLSATLAALPAAYRPVSVTPLSGQAFQVTWPVAAVPVTPIQ